CLTCWCPCVTFGQIAEMVDKRCTYCESRASNEYVLCLIRFIFYFVYDDGIGWHGNMERKKRMAALPPSIQVGMFR
ncbi:hypothetical protein SCA6_017592, partial [Theobroma cacao]